MILRESIMCNDVDSFHRHFDKLERVFQNNEQKMKEVLDEDGILCYAAHVGLNPVVETLIQKGVGKEKLYMLYVYSTLGIKLRQMANL